MKFEETESRTCPDLQDDLNTDSGIPLGQKPGALSTVLPSLFRCLGLAIIL